MDLCDSCSDHKSYNLQGTLVRWLNNLLKLLVKNELTTCKLLQDFENMCGVPQSLQGARLAYREFLWSARAGEEGLNLACRLEVQTYKN